MIKLRYTHGSRVAEDGRFEGTIHYQQLGGDTRMDIIVYPERFATAEAACQHAYECARQRRFFPSPVPAISLEGLALA